MKAMVGLLGALGAVTAVALASSKASAKSVPARRVTKGKSGTIWFTQGGPGPSPDVVRTSVFGSASGSDLVLMFDQKGSDKKTRKLVFAAPSTNAATAKADFI